MGVFIYSASANVAVSLFHSTSLPSMLHCITTFAQLLCSPDISTWYFHLISSVEAMNPFPKVSSSSMAFLRPSAPSSKPPQFFMLPFMMLLAKEGEMKKRRRIVEDMRMAGRRRSGISATRKISGSVNIFKSWVTTLQEGVSARRSVRYASRLSWFKRTVIELEKCLELALHRILIKQSVHHLRIPRHDINWKGGTGNLGDAFPRPDD